MAQILSDRRPNSKILKLDEIINMVMLWENYYQLDVKRKNKFQLRKNLIFYWKR